MIKISYKAAYYLLENNFRRRSIEEILKRDIPTNVFDSSLLFAMSQQDYLYLETMVNKRGVNDKDFVLFVDHTNENRPIVLKQNNDLTLLEFAILSVMCENKIHPNYFVNVVEAQADGKKADGKNDIDTSECIVAFNMLRERVQRGDWNDRK